MSRAGEPKPQHRSAASAVTPSRQEGAGSGAVGHTDMPVPAWHSCSQPEWHRVAPAPSRAQESSAGAGCALSGASTACHEELSSSTAAPASLVQTSATPQHEALGLPDPFLEVFGHLQFSSGAGNEHLPRTQLWSPTCPCWGVSRAMGGRCRALPALLQTEGRAGFCDWIKIFLGQSHSQTPNPRDRATEQPGRMGALLPAPPKPPLPRNGICRAALHPPNQENRTGFQPIWVHLPRNAPSSSFCSTRCHVLLCRQAGVGDEAVFSTTIDITGPFTYTAILYSELLMPSGSILPTFSIPALQSLHNSQEIASFLVSDQRSSLAQTLIQLSSPHPSWCFHFTSESQVTSLPPLFSPSEAPASPLTASPALTPGLPACAKPL